MEGQGVAASSASAGRQGESGSGAVAAAEFGHSAKTFVATGITDSGEGRERNGDDSYVTVPPSHPEASSPDADVRRSPDSSPPPRSPRVKQSSREPEEKSSQESQAKFSSQQIKPDKADNIGDPDRNDNVVARDENTGHNQTAAGLAPPAVDAPAVDAPAADSPAADDSPADNGEPETEQFAAVPPDDAEPGPAGPELAQPVTGPGDAAPAETGEPPTEQFPAIPPEDGPSVIVPEPV